MAEKIINAKNVKIHFSEKDYELGEYCLALTLIKSLYKKEKISSETMKEVEKIYEKRVDYC